MKCIFLFFSLLAFSLSSFAGNGVERGSVKIEGTKATQTEIENYLNKQLSRCSPLAENELFQVDSVSERYDHVDNGITDVYYKIQINHLDKNRFKINNLTIEILDSDFHNWRHYEEKLSFEIINDQNNVCNI
jgi:hypothetical protein